LDGRADLGKAVVAFQGLSGWSEDMLLDALDAFRRMEGHPLATFAVAAQDAMDFFPRHFAPGRSRAVQLTGYYEPELPASLVRTDDYRIPLHAMPEGGCSIRRADIDVRLRGLEIAYLRDDVDRFFLQVQGSGRLRLPDGRTVRVRYGGGNGRPYTSIGMLLIERGVFGLGLTADALKAWLRADPVRGRAVMDENESYVFFRFHDGPDADGPIGTMGVPVTPMRSVAADPEHYPLGTPIWLEVGGTGRLVIVQDTGGAIKGPGRIDLFHGTGDAAGLEAGRLNANGRATPLLMR
jgi:membrane-bound lytic murein transglycosylase A